MKKIFFLLFCLLPALQNSLAQNGNAADADGRKCYLDIRDRGHRRFAKKEFKEAEKIYKAAKECLTTVVNPDRFFTEIDSLIELADASDKKQRDDALRRAELEAIAAQRSAAAAQLAREQALAGKRTALANDYAYKASTMLREGDRSGAFTLAAFSLQFVDTANARSRQALLDAFYYNDHPLRATSGSRGLPWSNTLLGHFDVVSDVAFSPDRQRIATVSHDGTVKIWDANSGEEQASIRLGNELLLTLAFSPAGDTLAVAGDSKLIHLFEVRTQKSLGVLPRPGSEKALLNLQQQQQQAIVKPGGQSNDRRQQSNKAPAEEKKPSKSDDAEPVAVGHAGEIHSLAWHPGGKWIASASVDGTVKIWNARTGELVENLEASGVADVEFSPSGDRLGYSTSSGSVTVWKLIPDGAMPLATSSVFKQEGQQFGAISFSPDSNRMAVVANTQVIFLMENDTLAATLEGYEYVADIAFSPDGSVLASVNQDYYTNSPRTKIWDVGTGELILTLVGHTEYPTAVVFSPDGDRIATASQDQTVSVTELAGLPELQTFQANAQPLRLAFSADRRWLATLGSDDMLELRPATGKGGGAQKRFFNATAFTFSADGKRLFFAQRKEAVADDPASCQIVAVDLASDQIQTFPSWHGENTLVGMAISADGKLLLACNEIGVWTLSNPQAGGRLEQTGSADCIDFCFPTVALSRDGTWAAVAAGMGFKIWNTRTEKVQIDAFELPEVVHETAFSPDGKWFATAGGDNKVIIWNVKTGREELTLSGHSNSVTSVEFSPDGNKILTSAGRYTGALYRHNRFGSPEILNEAVPLPYPSATGADSTATGESWQPEETGMPDQPMRLPSSLAPIAYDPMPFADAAGSNLSEADYSLKIWDARTGAELLTLSGHAGDVLDATFAPDGNRVASASADGKVHVWQSHLDSLFARQTSPTLTQSKIEKLSLHEGLDALGGGVERMEKLMTKPQLTAFAQHFTEKTRLSANPAVVGNAYEKAFQIYRAIENKYADTSHRATLANLHDELAMKYLAYESPADRRQSMRHFEEAASLSPRDFTVQIHRAHGLLFSGRFAEAMAIYLEVRLLQEYGYETMLGDFQRFRARQMRCEEFVNAVRLSFFENFEGQWASEVFGIPPPPYPTSENDLLARLDEETVFLYKVLKFKNLAHEIRNTREQKLDLLRQALEQAQAWRQAVPQSKNAAEALDQVHLALSNANYDFAVWGEDPTQSEEFFREALRWNDLVSNRKSQQKEENYARIYLEWGYRAGHRKNYPEALRLISQSVVSFQKLLALSPFDYNYKYQHGRATFLKTWLLLQARDWQAAEAASQAAKLEVYDPNYLSTRKLNCHASLLLDRPDALACYQEMPSDSAAAIAAELAFFGASPVKIDQVNGVFERMKQVENARGEAYEFIYRLNSGVAFSDSLYTAGDPAAAFLAVQKWLLACDTLLANDLFFEAAYGKGDPAAEAKEAWRLEKAAQLGDGSFYALFAGKPDTAVYYSSLALRLDSSLSWVKTNQAAGYLFTGNWKKAKATYDEIKALPGDEIGFPTLGEACLDDFKVLKEAGIWHKDVPKAAAVLLGRELTKEEQGAFGKLK